MACSFSYMKCPDCGMKAIAQAWAETVKSVSSVWVCNRSQPKEPYFRACSGTVLQRGLGMRVCWMLPAFDLCRSTVAAKPEQRGRADAD